MDRAYRPNVKGAVHPIIGLYGRLLAIRMFRFGKGGHHEHHVHPIVAQCINGHRDLLRVRFAAGIPFIGDVTNPHNSERCSPRRV